MNETPELGRQVVLITALLRSILDVVGIVPDDGTKSIMKEIDALNLRAVHRYRSAAAYDDSARGRAALKDLVQVVERMDKDEHKDPMKSGVYVELVDYTWSAEQLNGPIMPGMKPERKLVRRHYVEGFVPLSDLKDIDTPINPMI